MCLHLLVSSVTLSLLVAACGDSQVTLVTGRVGSICALVVLNVAGTREGVC